MGIPWNSSKGMTSIHLDHLTNSWAIRGNEEIEERRHKQKKKKDGGVVGAKTVDSEKQLMHRKMYPAHFRVYLHLPCCELAEPQ